MSLGRRAGRARGTREANGRVSSMIRQARPTDSEACATIFNSFLAAGGLTDTEDPVSGENRRMWIGAHHGRYPIYVWTDDEDDARGWVSLSPFSPLPHDPRLAEIGVYVDEAYRGRGIGYELVSYVQAVAVDEFAAVIAIIFARNETSQALFAKCGFRRQVRLSEVAWLRGKSENVDWWVAPAPRSAKIATSS